MHELGLRDQANRLTQRVSHEPRGMACDGGESCWRRNELEFALGFMILRLSADRVWRLAGNAARSGSCDFGRRCRSRKKFRARASDAVCLSSAIFSLSRRRDHETGPQLCTPPILSLPLPPV
ncbi:hypothetical protein L1887_61758 [Cichorium endivia]|nr:hypothetical protein L1887_61758 [Cichorium endivia]